MCVCVCVCVCVCLCMWLCVHSYNTHRDIYIYTMKINNLLAIFKDNECLIS